MTDQKIKNLEMIQQVINRMANNSFTLKGWSITIIAGIFSLNYDKISWAIYILIYDIIIIFWFLDSYYLQLERRYRRLYNSRLEEREVNFSMQMPIPSIEEKTTYIQALVSKTEIGFYIALGIIISIVFLMM